MIHRSEILWGAGKRGGFTPWIEEPASSLYDAVRAWLNAYFAGGRPTPDFRLTPRGTAFPHLVWVMLGRIPYRRTTTYGELARHCAVKLRRVSMSAQAVGGAVGHDPISRLIPCHRVVGPTGG